MIWVFSWISWGCFKLIEIGTGIEDETGGYGGFGWPISELYRRIMLATVANANNLTRFAVRVGVYCILLFTICFQSVATFQGNMDTPSDEYEVENILDVRFNAETEEFLIQWKGFDEQVSLTSIKNNVFI